LKKEHIERNVTEVIFFYWPFSALSENAENKRHLKVVFFHVLFSIFSLS